MALNSGIQTNQILTNDDEVCIPRLSSINSSQTFLVQKLAVSEFRAVGMFLTFSCDCQ